MYQTILIPTDGSAPAWRAIPQAAYLASETGAALVVLGVVGPPTTDAIRHILLPLGLPEEHEALRRSVDETVRALKEAGVGQVEPIVAEGDAAEQIVEVARVQHVDLIVMGTHGHTGATGVLLGSVAESVLRHAPCPVLFIGPEK